MDVDHDTLKYFCKQPDLSGRQARWAELMQEFNMMIRYRRGKENKVADALSRIVHNMSFTVLESALMTEIKETQIEDEFVVQSLWPKANVIVPGKIDDLASRKGQVYARYTIEDGMLKRNGKVVVPNQNNLRQRVIRECHDSPCAGHPGVEKTYDLVKRDFFWPRMKNHIHEYVARCFACQVSKPERVRPPGLLQPLEIPSGRWESISMDFIVDLPTTQGGYDAYLSWLTV